MKNNVTKKSKSRTEVRFDRAQVALLAGVSQSTLERAVAVGALVPLLRGGGRDRRDVFALEVVAAWLREREKPSRHVAAKDRKLAAEARLKELTVAERESNLIDASAVESRWLQMMTAIRKSVVRVPATLVRASLIDASDEKRVDVIVRDALVNAKPPMGGSEIA